MLSELLFIWNSVFVKVLTFCTLCLPLGASWKIDDMLCCWRWLTSSLCPQTRYSVLVQPHWLQPTTYFAKWYSKTSQSTFDFVCLTLTIDEKTVNQDGNMAAKAIIFIPAMSYIVFEHFPQIITYHQSGTAVTPFGLFRNLRMWFCVLKPCTTSSTP